MNKPTQQHIQAAHHPSGRDEHKLFWLALGVSLLLHLAFYTLMPYLKSKKIEPIKRIVVEMDLSEQQQAAAPPAPAPKAEPQPVEPQPTPVVKEQVKPQKPTETAPVLTTQSPSAPADYVAQPASAPIAESVPDTPKASNATAKAAPSDNTASEASETAEVSREEAWDGYGQALYDIIGKNKNYPQIAIRRNWEGQVKVLAKFILGKLVDIVLVDSSGHDVLDKEALTMLRKAIGQLPISENLARKTFTVTVPVDFKLAEQ